MRKLVGPCMVICFLMAMPHAASAGKPSRVCPPSFELGLVTLEEDLALPRTVAALEAGELTVEEIEEFHATVDRAGDGLCFQTIPPSGAVPDAHAPWDFDYNIIDNSASAPGR